MVRTLAFLVALWGLVALPALCEGGLFSDCCENACPNGTDPGQPCECPPCVEVCNASAVLPKQPAGLNPAIQVAQPAVTIAAAASECAPASDAWSGAFNRTPDDNLPYPVSDRPLLL